MLGRVVIATTAFPPAAGGGAVRNIQVARGLAERGWEVTVITGTRRSPPWDDGSPLSDLPSTVRVLRVKAPDPVALGRRSAASGTQATGARAGWTPRAALRRFALDWILVPDVDVPWVPFAARAARRVMGRTRDTALVTAGPPHSAHLVGLLCRGRARRWIIDAQDPWAEHPFPSSSSRARRRLEGWLEARAFRAADVVASATESQRRRLAERYGAAVALATLPNGYDERDFRHAEADRVQGRLIVHVGSFYGARSPGVFLRALRSLAIERPELLRDVEVVLAGYADRDAEGEIGAALADPALAGHLRSVSLLSRAASVRLMLSADVLLLVTDPGAGGRDLIPLKTFEYLRAGKPILALLPEGETAALLRSTGGAVIVPVDDPGRIASALASLLSGEHVQIAPREHVSALEIGTTIERLTWLLEKDR